MIADARVTAFAMRRNYPIRLVRIVYDENYLREFVMEIDRSNLPRCEKLDGSTLRIVPAYTEAGMFCEANVITVTDGNRTALYIPLKIVEPKAQ